MKLTAKLALAALLLNLCPTSIMAKPEAKESPDEVIMTTFGAISAQAVFSNYMAIAELADLVGAKAYDSKKATELAVTYKKLSEAAKDSLENFADKGDLEEGDKASVKELILINDLLMRTADGVAAYVEDSSKENSAAFQKTREKAWKAISKFMGIE